MGAKPETKATKTETKPPRGRKAASPDKTVENGAAEPRDARGRFAVGNSGGPGRPRGFDFRKLVTESVGDQQLGTDLLDVYRGLLKFAKIGDTAAAKLLLDRLCTADPISLELHDVPVEQAAGEIAAILAAAKERQAAASKSKAKRHAPDRP